MSHSKEQRQKQAVESYLAGNPVDFLLLDDDSSRVLDLCRLIHGSRPGSIPCVVTARVLSRLLVYLQADTVVPPASGRKRVAEPEGLFPCG
jgi:hypothetical protein